MLVFTPSWKQPCKKQTQFTFASLLFNTRSRDRHDVEAFWTDSRNRQTDKERWTNRRTCLERRRSIFLLTKRQKKNTAFTKLSLTCRRQKKKKEWHIAGSYRFWLVSLVINNNNNDNLSDFWPAKPEKSMRDNIFHLDNSDLLMRNMNHSSRVWNCRQLLFFPRLRIILNHLTKKIINGAEFK